VKGGILNLRHLFKNIKTAKTNLKVVSDSNKN